MAGPVADPPICPVCGLVVVTGDDVHHSCREAYEASERPTLFANRCDVCGGGCPEGRLRCDTCAPPALPDTYRRARARLDGL